MKDVTKTKETQVKREKKGDINSISKGVYRPIRKR